MCFQGKTTGKITFPLIYKITGFLFFFKVPFSLIEKKVKKEKKIAMSQKSERIFTVLKHENSKFTPLGPKRHVQNCLTWKGPFV